ncbi:MAG: hypothetical protein Q7V57_07385 [Actinomycetota bacterium]|nr:hypothetical protein [Actinomycetota bacterium]
MNVLTEALVRHADMAHPSADLPDVYRRMHRRRRRARGRRIAMASAVLVGVIGMLTAIAMVRSKDAAPATAPVVPPRELTLSDLGGLGISIAGPDQSYQYSTLERADPDAATGAYSVVVRLNGGTLVDGNAIVTYPDPNSVIAEGEVHAREQGGVLTLIDLRPGGRVAVRGIGLTAEQVQAIADATVIVDGRPVVNPTAAIASFTVVAIGTSRPPVIRESRLGCDALGEDLVLGAMCYTGLTTSPGFEGAVYAAGFQPGPLVHGEPSVVSTIGGGNGTLAWELMPGVIAYIGYSGTNMGDDQIAALGRLANRASLLSPAEWSATDPQVVEQSNEW